MEGPPRLGDLARDNAARGRPWTEFTVALTGVVADLRLHIHNEEDVLFPAVLAGVGVSP